MSKAKVQNPNDQGSRQFMAFKPGVEVERQSRNYQLLFRILPEVEEGIAQPFRDADGDLTGFYAIHKMVVFWSTSMENSITALVEPADIMERNISMEQQYPFNVVWNFFRQNTRKQRGSQTGEPPRPDLVPWVKSPDDKPSPISRPKDVMILNAVVYQNMDKLYPNGKQCVLMASGYSPIERFIAKLQHKTGDQYTLSKDIVAMGDGNLCAFTHFGGYPKDANGNLFQFLQLDVPIDDPSYAGYGSDFFVLQNEAPINLDLAQIPRLDATQNGVLRKQTVEEQLHALMNLFPPQLFREIFMDYPYLTDGVQRAMMSRAHAVGNAPESPMQMQAGEGASQDAGVDPDTLSGPQMQPDHAQQSQAATGASGTMCFTYPKQGLGPAGPDNSQTSTSGESGYQSDQMAPVGHGVPPVDNTTQPKMAAGDMFPFPQNIPQNGQGPVQQAPPQTSVPMASPQTPPQTPQTPPQTPPQGQVPQTPPQNPQMPPQGANPINGMMTTSPGTSAEDFQKRFQQINDSMNNPTPETPTSGD